MPETATPVSLTRAPAELPPRRVMIVDDNIDGAISLSLFLQAAGGQHVCTCYDAAGALAWAAFERPDAFILDIGLPQAPTAYEMIFRSNTRSASHTLATSAIIIEPPPSASRR